jgi:DNA-directed RNA polymerase subunit RPC12/RpoP
MINFKCKTCGNEMEAEDNRKGVKGKCPVCSTIIIVPAHSEKNLIFDEDRTRFSETIVQKLIHKVHEKYGDKIIKCSVVKDREEAVVFQLRTDGHGGRSQSVSISTEPPLQNLFEHKSVVVSSKIGDLSFIEDKNSLIELIKTVDSFHFLNLHINKNDEAEVVFRGLFTTTNVSVVVDMIALVAHCADNIESLSGTDKY